MTVPGRPVAVVVDASVIVKWLLPEEFTADALRLLEPEWQILVPAHTRAEVANALWKRHRRGQLTRDETIRGVSVVLARIDLRETRISPGLLNTAMRLAIEYGRTIYDSLYVALALSRGCQFVTADRRLYNALAPALPGTMLWVGDSPTITPRVAGSEP